MTARLEDWFRAPRVEIGRGRIDSRIHVNHFERIESNSVIKTDQALKMVLGWVISFRRCFQLSLLTLPSTPIKDEFQS